MAEQMQVQTELAGAAMGIGVALRLGGRLNVTECAAGAAGELPGACAAEKWLETALALGYPIARLHLARLAFDLGEEQKALAHLQGYLSTCVEQGPNFCNGCGQTRGNDAPMLTCAGCRVARFCSAEHQKMASRGVSSGGCLVLGRHKDACGLLGMWRQQVLKQGNSPNVLREELLVFLRR